MAVGPEELAGPSMLPLREEHENHREDLILCTPTAWHILLMPLKTKPVVRDTRGSVLLPGSHGRRSQGILLGGNCPECLVGGGGGGSPSPSSALFCLTLSTPSPLPSTTEPECPSLWDVLPGHPIATHLVVGQPPFLEGIFSTNPRPGLVALTHRNRAKNSTTEISAIVLNI